MKRVKTAEGVSWIQVEERCQEGAQKRKAEKKR